MPLQSPLYPQVSTASFLQTSWGSGFPAATGTHCPRRPSALQRTQAPVQATAQHTPSVQKLESHSAAAPQEAPIGFLPQLPAVQVRPSHCVLVVQALKHRLFAVSQA